MRATERYSRGRDERDRLPEQTCCLRPKPMHEDIIRRYCKLDGIALGTNIDVFGQWKVIGIRVTR